MGASSMKSVTEMALYLSLRCWRNIRCSHKMNEATLSTTTSNTAWARICRRMRSDGGDRSEVLVRLLKLNCERCDEEIKAGLHDMKNGGTHGRTIKSCARGTC